MLVHTFKACSIYVSSFKPFLVQNVIANYLVRMFIKSFRRTLSSHFKIFSNNYFFPCHFFRSDDEATWPGPTKKKVPEKEVREEDGLVLD